MSKNFRPSFNVRPLTTRAPQKALNDEEGEEKEEDLDEDEEEKEGEEDEEDEDNQEDEEDDTEDSSFIRVVKIEEFVCNAD